MLKCKEKIYICFIDFQKAFDPICHGELFLTLTQSSKSKSLGFGQIV